MSIYKKILIIIVLFIIIFCYFSSSVYAIFNETKENSNAIVNNENTVNNIVNNTITNTKEESINSTTEAAPSLNVFNDVNSTNIKKNQSINENKYEEKQEEKSSLSINEETKQTENPFFDFISNEKMDLLLNSLSVNKTLKSGVIIDKNSQTLLLKFINGHSSYTYSVNENNVLICDKLLRENKNLDIFAPIETEMDISINEVMNNNLTILKISPTYFDFEDEKVVSLKFDSSKYLQTYENNNIRIIILNSSIYNESNNISYNPDLLDSFIKSLTNVQYHVLNNLDSMQNIDNIESLSTKPQSISATSIGHQTVWGGPKDNGTYATIGSVDDGESVIILGKEDDYYHIQYNITSGTYSGKKRSGYILRSNLNVSIVDKLLVKEEEMNGGYRYSSGNNYIESCDNFSYSVNANSSISDTEGITLLYTYDTSDSNGSSYTVAFIEYSTSNGMKRGYIKNNNLKNPFSSTLIKSPSKVITYTGPDSNKFSLDTGAVGLNEYVCAIGYTGDYIFLEYNTNSGRRRAFGKASELKVSASSLNLVKLPDIKYNQTYASLEKQDVSAGPGACYTLCAYRGVVGKFEPVYKAASNNPVYEQLGYSYIVYHAGSSYKGGYVLSKKLELNVNPTFPDMPTYNESNNEFARTYIGQTGLGQPLYAYKIGTGNNKIYLCFNQHGWEDGGTGDGVELVLLAKEFMQIVNKNKDNNVSSSTSKTASISEINFVELLKKWTVYVIPSINRDGITSGWTNYGPGRSDVVTAIDINRNWDTSVYTYYTNPDDPRNYNGTKKMGTSSAQALASYLTSDDVRPNANGKSILLDIHGWDNEVIAWDANSKKMGEDYFLPHFNQSNFIGYTDSNSFRSRTKSDSGAGGYLMRWAVEKLGTTNSILLELPLKTDKSIDHSFIVNNNYSTKLTTAILNMMKNEYNQNN